MQRLGYVPGLDGLRALAVSTVFLFHAGVVPGGFIGVDVFFVISGFLITSLAISEIEHTGTLALGAFWGRRVRRLLPAILGLMAAVVAYSLWEGGAALRRVGDDVVATTFYVANWAQIGEGRDYFAQYDSQPLLEHAWSLSIEEQFYLVWPILLLGLVFLSSRISFEIRTIVVIVATCAVGISLATTLWLKEQPGTSLTRLYYGTDTRLVGLSMGAALGAVVRPGHRAFLPGGDRRRDVAGFAALGALAVVLLLVDGRQDWLYGIGFLLIAALSSVAIVAALGTGRFARVLAFPPAVALGRVSYGVYLWHWPVIVILDRDRTGLSGLSLGALWVAVTAVCAAGSWFLIERRAPLPSLGRPLRLTGYVGVAVVLCTGAVVGADAAIARERDASYSIPSAPVPRSVPPAAVSSPSTSLPPATGTPLPVISSTTAAPTTSSATTTTLPAVRPMPADRPLRLMLVGDSVAFSLRDGEDKLPMQEVFDVPGYGQVELLNLGTIGCPVISEGVSLLADDTVFRANDICYLENRFEAEAKEFEPDVVLTLFGWPGNGGRQRFDDGETVRPCTSRYDEAWRTDHQDLVDRLGNGRPVIVSDVPPAAGSTGTEVQPTRCLNDVVGQLDAPIFGLQEWLCPDYNCSISETLRPDGVHFRSSGQLQRDVTASLLAQVLTVAGY